MRYWSHPPWTERAQAEAKIDEITGAMRRGEACPWAVADPATDRLLGTCAVFALVWGHARGELGYALTRAAQGRGLDARGLPGARRRQAQGHAAGPAPAPALSCPRRPEA